MKNIPCNDSYKRIFPYVCNYNSLTRSELQVNKALHQDEPTVSEAKNLITSLTYQLVTKQKT